MTEPLCGRCGKVSEDGRNWKFRDKPAECDDCFFRADRPQPETRTTTDDRGQTLLALETR